MPSICNVFKWVKKKKSHSIDIDIGRNGVESKILGISKPKQLAGEDRCQIQQKAHDLTGDVVKDNKT